ncbi:MAG TPA: rhodanese-like domain-containing protein, partial [Chitinophagaceae bacterium]|nr:rhodanese-like domain-containing protein [Chitinophagaceae bacterium]
ARKRFIANTKLIDMKTITPEEVKARMDAGEKLHLLDVREPHERAEFNIGGAFVPLGKIQTMQFDDIEDWKNDEVIVYCRSGNRSGQACLIMETAGYTNTVNLVGGMLAWQERIAK